MSDTKISALTAATALAGTEPFPAVQGGATVKVTGQQLMTLITGSATLSGATVTTSKPLLDFAQTWNAGGVTFTGLKLNVTATASAAASLLLDLQVGGTSMFTANKTGDLALHTLTATGGTVTVSTPIVSGTQTWNDGSVTFTALKLNVTDTASAAASLFVDLQLAGFSKFNVSKGGTLTLDSGTSGSNNRFAIVPSGFSVSFSVSGTSGVVNIGNNGSMLLNGSTSSVRLSNSGTPDVFLTRSAAAVLQLGTANAAVPVAQTVQAQGSRSGTDSDVGGANLTIAAGSGTGTGTVSTLALQSPVAVASGTGAQTQTTGLTIKVGVAVLTNYTVATLPAAATAGAGATAFVTDASTTIILGLGLTVTGSGANKVPVYSDGTNWIIG